MEPAFGAYPGLLHCGIYREVVNNRPQSLSPVEMELLEATPPPDLTLITIQAMLWSEWLDTITTT